ncbi:MAG TPA: glycoside hydrolase family 127 protein [Clostridia bacterium]|nr:glycoside hydrolase family 127 protein [Clostridia bacterium]
MAECLSELDLKKICIDDPFWNKRLQIAAENTIPFMWEAFNDNVPGAEPSYAIKNFRIASGLEEGKHNGVPWQDSDLYKYIEAAGYRLQTEKDPELEARIDGIVDMLEKAQLPDGYLDTYYSLNDIEKRWTNIKDDHELYCMGHFIEAAISYYKGTGKRKILDIACRVADHIDSVFGPEEGKLKGYPGHEEIELALFKLYKITKNKKYLDLAAFFINQRGTVPHFFEQELVKRGQQEAESQSLRRHEYNQSHMPVREQADAVGHAVRALYLYTAVADIANELGDESLINAAERLWASVVERQMHITGGVGTQFICESFTFDYDLPNDTTYNETCATIGLMMFAQRMNRIKKDARYADIVERALYNGFLSGVSLDGKSYFYVNPLEMVPDIIDKRKGFSYVKYVRQSWFGCACCPPNVLRTLMNLGSYIYAQDKDTAYINLYIGGKAEFEFENSGVVIEQTTDYPWGDTVEIIIKNSAEFSLALRIPGWCDSAHVYLNGKALNIARITNAGYAVIKRSWKEGDKVTLKLPMQVKKIQANPKIRSDAGKVAVQRGPVVYCLEQCDNGKELWNIVLAKNANFKPKYEEDLLDGVVAITADAIREVDKGWDCLYSDLPRTKRVKTTVKFIPYYAWSNREPGEMMVWVRSER